MIIDIVIIVMLVWFTIYGCMYGFMRGLCSMVVPAVGLLLALKTYGTIAPVFNRVIHSYPVSAVAAFLLVVGLTWMGARLVRALLLKLVDWSRLSELDRFLGGIFGLARGLALVWLVLAIVLTAFPPSVGVIQHSTASTRLLALAEHVAGRAPGRGRVVPRVQQTTGNLVHSVAAFKQAASQFGGMGEN